MWIGPSAPIGARAGPAVQADVYVPVRAMTEAVSTLTTAQSCPRPSFVYETSNASTAPAPSIRVTDLARHHPTETRTKIAFPDPSTLTTGAFGPPPMPVGSGAPMTSG